jgi:hypothetical protein
MNGTSGIRLKAFKETEKNPIFAQLVISLNLVLAGLRLGLKNCQVGL